MPEALVKEQLKTVVLLGSAQSSRDKTTYSTSGVTQCRLSQALSRPACTSLFCHLAPAPSLAEVPSLIVLIPLTGSHLASGIRAASLVLTHPSWGYAGLKTVLVGQYHTSLLLKLQEYIGQC